MKSKIKGCTHHETKVVKMAEGGTVPTKTANMRKPYMMAEPKSKRTEVLQAKTMKDGSQQWTRGKTSADRRKTIMDAEKTALENYRKADSKVKAGTPGFKKALDESSRQFKGYLQLGDAFINELNDEGEK